MNEINKILDKAMFEIARRIENELVLTCPYDKGRLRSSIKVKPIKEGLLIWMAEYGEYVEFGTPPHIIKPINKKALKFKSGKNIVFAKEVKHPGTRPQPFIRTVMMTKLPIIIQEEFDKVLKIN